ncbi:2',5' RNA ligase family [Corynebacterium atrinae]|uniref:RNA 2',3'-cyclic phosphodiesterase n=1 Tax=Corynebacterium atrinae TaxID=1336740 RepID=UPI0025B34CEA|nr:RNA 2',3'-cyclic phosphodiesterase [Corynebacterium atrinae]WJY63963.1 2',5' RNA ligase family [Corynebacterium atrinae]
MRRLFSALLPSEAAREHLVSTLRPLRGEFPNSLRWVDPDNWHVTLCFYGEQPNDTSQLAAHLAHAASACEPLTLRIKGAGSFGHRTLWMGVAGDKKPLTRLMADSALGALGLESGEPGHRPQKPHLTIARTRERWAVGELVHILNVYQGPAFACDEAVLMESHLGRGRGGGPHYEVLERIKLGRSAKIL